MHHELAILAIDFGVDDRVLGDFVEIIGIVGGVLEAPLDLAGCGQLLMYRYFRNSILIDLLPELFPPGFRERERPQA
jgi:hypothetical protein